MGRTLERRALSTDERSNGLSTAAVCAMPSVTFSDYQWSPGPTETTHRLRLFQIHGELVPLFPQCSLSMDQCALLPKMSEAYHSLRRHYRYRRDLVLRSSHEIVDKPFESGKASTEGVDML